MSDLRPDGAGWYPHDNIKGWQRYYDGVQWTNQARPYSSDGAKTFKRPGVISRWLDSEARAHEDLQEARAKIVCQFCQQAGHVTVSHVKKNRRLSATRIAGTFATAGGSLLLTGVHKKGHWTRLTCSNCQMAWDLAE